MEEVVLFRGTNETDLNGMLNREFNDIAWWTTNIENLNHYNEGASVELVIRIDSEQENDYIRGREELTPEYTFGRAEMRCPKNSTWYSISRAYMENNIVSVKEIFPVFTGEEEGAN